jgi:curved DNA-binding protein CbpA
MSSKDYYKTLEISHAASTHDIKKAYRRLAHKYHPDKNSGNKVSEARFKEIHEAYKVLSDDKKRHEYNQKRFDRHHGSHKKPPPTPANAAAVLAKSRELRKKVSAMDPDRMNKEALYTLLQNLLSAYNIALLRAENDYKINFEVIENVLSVCRHLDYTSARQITNLLLSVAGADNNAYTHIDNFLRKQKVQSLWHRYNLLVVFVLALLLCFLIYKISANGS